MATQNPMDCESTFALPEAQRDRFQMQIDIEFPTEEEERAIVDSYAGGKRIHEEILPTLEQVLNLTEIHQIRELVRTDITVDEEIRNFIVQVVNATRQDADVRIGASPRGSIALLDSARAFALLRGRSSVAVEDLRDAIVPTLAHRVIMSGETDPRMVLGAIARRIRSGEPFQCRHASRGVA
jgi:MoxR-like ATPase